jgi:hypothetical protein
MTQVYQPEESLRGAAAFSTPPSRSSPPFFEPVTTDESAPDRTSEVPPGWQTFRDEQNRLVYLIGRQARWSRASTTSSKTAELGEKKKGGGK